VVSLIWFIIHSWRSRDPLVCLQILKNRNFAVGCVLILLFGMAIYSTVTVLPLFYQELLGYTAFTAGLVVAPRGLGAIVGSVLVGQISSKIDNRILLALGFLVFGLTTLYFGNITLDISPTTLFWPIVITGVALAFVFVPISTMAYGTLRNDQIGNASGLFNLMRNVGGSIGISIAQTLLVRRAALHQNEITNFVPITGAAFQQAVQTTRLYLAGSFLGPANAAAGANANLYQQLIRQSLYWAFVDVFRLLALLCLGCVAIVWAFQKVKGKGPPAGAH